MSLRISTTLTLPVDAATQTFGILAKRGAGKSNAAVVMAEEMHRSGIPWVAIDPKGDWWGMRSSADGTGPGLPLPVFGGEHGDIPLEPTAGALIADLVVDERLTCVLDVSTFSKGDQRRFLLAFAERLVRRNTEPLHLFLEEAHEYLPQRVMRDEAVLVGAWSKIVKQGRFRGIGCTLISQRSASLNKDVLTQVDSLIVMRTTAPQDRKAVEAWVTEHDMGHDLVASLPGLDSGEAWIWSPEFLRATKRFRFRRRSTFDSGATPTVGAKRQQVATLADVDLAAIKEQMAETIERAKADDPKALRAEIARLRNELASRPKETVTVERVVEVVPAEVVRRLTEAELAVAAAADGIARARAAAGEGEGGADRKAARGVDQGCSTAPTAVLDPSPSRPEPRARGKSQAEAVMSALPADGVQLGKRERAILSVLVQYPQGRTHRQIALLTGYSPKASTIGAGLSTLRKHGFITPGGLPIATDAGIKALGDDVEPLPRGPELLAYWREQLGKREALLLDALLEVHPASMTHDELADRTGYSRDASTVGAGMSKLRGLELVDGWRISDDFAEAIR